MQPRPPEVAEGVYALGTKWANFHVVVEDGEAILVDAGYPGYWPHLSRALRALALPADAVRAVIVTHHHTDHSGTAERMRSEGGAEVLVGVADAPKVDGTQRSHPPSGFYRESWRPSMIRYLLHSARMGGARGAPVGQVTTVSEDRVLDLPGRPRMLPTPGHTAGHLSVVLESRGALLAGDAMRNFDYPSGKTGLGLHRFNEDREGAYASLERLAPLDLPVVLFGHGDPWRAGVANAVEIVRARS